MLRLEANKCTVLMCHPRMSGFQCVIGMAVNHSVLCLFTPDGVTGNEVPFTAIFVIR